MTPVSKLLVLDGIAGIPLGREIAEACRETGVAVSHFDCLQAQRRPLHGVRSAWAKLRTRAADGDRFKVLPRLPDALLQALIERERPSHILVVGFAYKFFAPQTLRRLAERTGARLCLYDTDTCNLYDRRREFIFFVENELPAYHRILSCSAVTTRFFRATCGLNAEFVPFGANPIAAVADGPLLDVLFVGSCDLRRIFLLEGIRERVSIRGNRWQRNLPLISPGLRQRVDDRPVWGEELHRLLARSRIVLNITRTDFHGAETGINLRIFEALAAGCFLLTDHCDELEELFVPGEEIETYRSARELAEKVEHYLADDSAREAIARTGHANFLRRHTWLQRVKTQLLPQLETA